MKKYILLGAACVSLFCAIVAIFVGRAIGNVIEASPVIVAGLIIVACGVLAAILTYLWESARMKIAEMRFKRSTYTHAESKSQDLAEAVLSQVQRGLIHPTEYAGVEFAPNPRGKALAIPDAPLIPNPTQRPNLIDTIANLDCILFVGTRGRGKTTNMLRLMEARSHNETAIVFDTHAEPNKWPLAHYVIGSEPGQSEAERLSHIWTRMMWIMTQMNDRLDKHRATGKTAFEPWTIYIDELTHLPGQLRDTLQADMSNQFTKPLLNGGRKVGINLVLGSHSDRANALALEGNHDLRGSFDAIAKLIKAHGEWYAIVDFGEGYEKDTHYELANPFNNGVVIPSNDHDFEESKIYEGEATEVKDASDAVNISGYLRPPLTEFQQRCVDAYYEALQINIKPTLNTICKLVWPNKKSIPGRDKPQVRQVLAALGFDVSHMYKR